MLGREYMKLGKHSMRESGILALAGFVALAATIQQGYAQGGGPPGGVVRALAIDPSTPATLYGGTNPNGVFKSTDGGTSWTAVNSGLTGFGRSVLALAI